MNWSASYTGDATITVRAESACGQTDTETRTVTVTTQITYYEDRDRDGFYVNTVTSCSNPDTNIYVTADLVTGSGDCDDYNSGLNPNTIWYLDADGDGHAVSSQQSCTSPGEDYVLSVLSTSDCDDDDPAILSERRWFLDRDGDNFPLANSFVTSCTNPGLGTADESFYKYGAYSQIDCDDTVYDLSNCNGNSNNTITGENYVYSRSYQVRRSEATDFGDSDEGLIQNITYFDGLGRPIQQIALEQSPKDATGTKKDIVTQMTYDDFGRMEKEWLPTPMDIGEFSTIKTGVESAILGHYATDKYENTNNPFSEKEFEDSPLNRILKQAAPGNDWAMGQGHEIEFGYDTNTDADAVKQLSVNTNAVTENGVITYETTLVESTEYAAGELNKNITYDENHSGTDKDYSVEEFTNKEGQVVLKRTYENEVPHDTYYVYDDFGNLSFVLPPKVTVGNGVSTVEMSELGYQYTYDHRNRLVIKKLPGKGEEYIVYNKLDQPIMTQDANQRLDDEWLFTKYDAFGRAAYTGKVTDGRERTEVQNSANNVSGNLWVNRGSYTNGGINIGYENTTYPTTGITEVLTINYYDDYNFDRANEPTPPTTVFGENIDDRTKGMATGTKVRVLDPLASPNQADWITTITRYNYQGNAIYTYNENNYLSTVDMVTTDIDFVGRPLKVKTSHTRNGTTIVTIDNFTYDHAGRLLTQTQCIGDETLGSSCSGGGNSAPVDSIIENETVTNNRIATESVTVRPITTISGTVTLQIDPNATGGGIGGDTELIVFNDYDELGQLRAKKVGGAPENTYDNTTGLQTVDYTYNVRGWLTGINDTNDNDTTLTPGADDLFSYRIGYNEGPNALYNGNIALTQWQTQSQDATLKQYDYTYDALNRIKTAIDNTGKFNLATVGYDKNGNITALTRLGHVTANPILNDTNDSDYGTMDVLDYAYHNSEVSNRLFKVRDNGNDTYGFKDSSGDTQDYWYDANGNMVRDLNKGIGTTSTDGIVYNHLNLPIIINKNDGIITYTYDANGVKQKKTVTVQNTTTTVIDYAGNYIYENSQLQFLSHIEGYLEINGSGYNYIFQYRDHLGNVRLTYSDANNDGSIDLQDEIIKESNYYAFGLEHKGYNSNISSSGNSLAQNWKFNNEELEKGLDIEIYSFKYRQYDATIGIWLSVDPLADAFFENSPYNYNFNNPIYFIDPDGRAPKTPTITNIFLIINANGTQKLAALNNILNNGTNENWRIQFSENVEDGLSKVEEHVGEEKIDNLVLRTHGSKGKVFLNHTETGDGGIAGDVSDLVEARSVNDFSNNADLPNFEEFFVQNYGQEKFDNFAALKGIGDLIRDNGNLFFTACQAGSDNGTLGKSLQHFFGRRFNIYMNTVNSLMYRRKHSDESESSFTFFMFDAPLQNTNTTGGFILITPDRKVRKLGKTIQFNSSGSPFSVVPENSPDPSYLKSKN